MVFDETYERHWDTWAGPKTSSLFSVQLGRGADGKWTLGTEFPNLLKGTGHSSPVEPFGGNRRFLRRRRFRLYTTKDATLPKAWHTKQNIYLVSTTDPGNPKELTSGQQGATHSPVLNSDATKAACLSLRKMDTRADKANIVLYDLVKGWDRSPDSIAWSTDGKLLYLTAGEHALIKVFALPVPATPAESTTHPDLHPKAARPSAIQPLPKGRLLFSRSSFTSPNDVYLIRDLKDFEDNVHASETSVEFKGSVEQITRFTADALQGKDLDKGEAFWFKGALDKECARVDPEAEGMEQGRKEEIPRRFLDHGGPQSAWEDQWSNRWNPNVFAQQGYFVVAVNPTGSTTFGQEFTDAIAEDWGGKPFVDLRAGWQYILDTYPQIDADRAVAAGASWGGTLSSSWIQSHPEFGFNFKALVCHDGVFDSTYNLFFTKALSEKFSPSNYVANWSTPQLLIHGSKDFRLPETESIGPFHALQQLGVPTRLVVFPTENHWVLNHGNSLKWHYEVFKWFDEFVGDRSE
ncbi:Alpha/Beta hydrolase protein [Mycena olivaceomarginata]|nr:Alpha/Beta hydrolase protein [Mycena olivaceomarginata]